MLAICSSLQTLAIQESSYLPKLAAIDKDACDAFEDECKKIMINMKPAKPVARAVLPALKNEEKSHHNFNK
jgi:hypothetical protein